MALKFEDFKKKLRKNLLDSKFLKRQVNVVTDVGTLLKQTRYIYNSGKKGKSYTGTLIKAAMIK